MSLRSEPFRIGSCSSRLIQPSNRVTWTTLCARRQWRVRSSGFLPGDVNNDGTSSAGDVLDLIDALNSVGVERAIWSLDIDRSGVAGAATFFNSSIYSTESELIQFTTQVSLP